MLMEFILFAERTKWSFLLKISIEIPITNNVFEVIRVSEDWSNIEVTHDYLWTSIVLFVEEIENLVQFIVVLALIGIECTSVR